MENINEIKGFDGEILHPALDIKNGVLVLGFRYRQKPDKMENLIVVVRNGEIEVHQGWGFSFVHSGTTYFVDKSQRLLMELGVRWSLVDLNLVIGEYRDVARKKTISGRVLYQEIRDVLMRFIELEQEIDYSLATAWIMGTYFFPSFSAYPFLHVKAPKRSGKSQFLDLLTQLSFNATKARPTRAALGDTVDGLRGTLLIDQADSLDGPRSEELLEDLTGSYKKNGSRRRLVNMDKGKRQTLEFETYSPKVFASQKELPEDLRDRCLPIPLIRTNKNYPDPNDENPMWPDLRSKLYRLLIADYPEVADEYVIQRALYKQNNEIKGRHLELWLPFVTILKHCGAGETEILAAKVRFLSQYQFTEAELGEIDAGVIEAVLISMGDAQEIILAPKQVAETMDPECFDADKSLKQRAGLVGWAIKRMNLSSEKKSRTKEGVSYLFIREKVERVRSSYFPASSTPSAQTQRNTQPLAVHAPNGEVEACKSDLHSQEPAAPNYTPNNEEFSEQKGAM